MGILAIIEAILSLGSFSGGRMTVKDRYEMKKKVRELKKRDADPAERKQR